MELFQPYSSAEQHSKVPKENSRRIKPHRLKVVLKLCRCALSDLFPGHANPSRPNSSALMRQDATLLNDGYVWLYQNPRRRDNREETSFRAQKAPASLLSWKPQKVRAIQKRNAYLYLAKTGNTFLIPKWFANLYSNLPPFKTKKCPTNRFFALDQRYRLFRGGAC